jgi:hypothetical protein
MVWCVIALEQALVWDSFTLEHGQLLIGVHALQNLPSSVKLSQWNNTPNHTKLMAVRCSCVPDDGCK